MPLLEVGAVFAERLQLIFVGVHFSGITAGEGALFSAVLEAADVVVETRGVLLDAVDVGLLLSDLRVEVVDFGAGGEHRRERLLDGRAIAAAGEDDLKLIVENE